jgi:hypothetical protein
MLIGYKTQRVPANLRIYPDILGIFFYLGKDSVNSSSMETRTVHQLRKKIWIKVELF